MSPLDIDPSDAYTRAAIFSAHRGGKLAISSTCELETIADLSVAYTPGVAEVCTAISQDSALASEYTWASRAVAIVTDGSAVLGLGDIGPSAALPVMEGKAVLFKRFADLNAFPVCLNTKDPDEIVETIVRIAPSFGGVNLEDISAPRCFEIEKRLDELLPIPVFHDDQHGTAIVTLAGLRNACMVTGRSLSDLRVVISGAGAAGIAICRMLLAAGIGDVAVADSHGILDTSVRPLSKAKTDIAAITNKAGVTGSLADALADADVFIGVSGGQVPEEAVATMAPGSFVFAMANPTPEIAPELASKYAAIVATGRSDYPNQINNVLAFPGVFAGAFDAGATSITEPMKLAAAEALADVIADELSPVCVVPSPFDARVVPAVATAVAKAAAS